jgi:hypothetical protein
MLKAVQEWTRHANSRVVLDTYVQAVTEQKRGERGKIAREVIGP